MYTNFVKGFFSKRLIVSEKIEKIRAHIRVRYRESKMAEIPPCSLDSHIKASQLGERGSNTTNLLHNSSLSSYCDLKSIGSFHALKKIKKRRSLFCSVNRMSQRAMIFSMRLYSEFLKIKDFNTQDNGLSVHVKTGLGK